VRLQPVVHRGRDGSFRAVLLALSTWHKIGLAGVGAIFVVFALSSAFLWPRYRPDFPGRRLGTFILVTLVIFVGMLAAVEIFGAEPSEKASAESGSTSTPSTPTSSGGGGQTVQVSEKEFKITLPSTSLKAGSYTFDLSNDGKIPHDLTIQGPGVSKAHTPVINGGQKATLKVKLTAGTYDFYCSVPGHKQLGMDVKVKVA
jgi:plastocyanin